MVDMEMLYQCIMAGIQVFFGLYFYIRLAHKEMKIWPYLLSGGCAVWIICSVPDARIIQWAAFILLLAAVGILACRADWKAAVLYAVLTVEIMQLSYGIVDSWLSILYPYMSVFDLEVVGYVFMLAGEAAALALSGLCYGMAARYLSDEIQLRYMLMVLIPDLMIFIMGEYIHSSVYDMVVTDTEHLHTDHYRMLLIQILGLASLFCILSAHKKLLDSFHRSKGSCLLEQEEHALLQYVEEAKARYDETRSFRHDIKNHITVIKELLQSGQLEQAVSYIEDMDDISERISFPCSTNNPVVDMLVGNKMGIAKSMGISVSCSLILPYPCGLRDIDICIVLSNALDNALHACKDMAEGTDRFIHVSGRIQGDLLMMEITNSFHGEGTFKKGTGLSNVGTVAEKYGGAMSIEAHGDVFALHVLLIIPQEPEDL